MAFLDFIKNRQAQQQSVAQPKPETAREMYSRQAEQVRTTQKPVQQMSDAEKMRAREAGARLDKATQHLRQSAPAQTLTPSDSASGPEPMRQNMTGQEREAPALSPTTAQLGQTANEKGVPEHSQEERTNAPAKTQNRPQTIARTRPSWER
jgi:hypothetical protein